MTWGPPETAAFRPTWIGVIRGIGIRNGIADGLSVGLGVFNMLDSELSYAQPYNSYHAPLPGQVREFIVRVSYARPLYLVGYRIVEGVSS